MACLECGQQSSFVPLVASQAVERQQMRAGVRLGEDGDLQAVLMMSVGRDGGRHGHWSGSHDRCARPRAVWAAARPHRAALKRRVQKFRFVLQLRLQQAEYSTARRYATRYLRLYCEFVIPVQLGTVH